MNASVSTSDSSSDLSLPTSPKVVDLPQASSDETAPAADDKICWIEMRQSTYLPDQQVELLHLQAEADALLLQLQALQQKSKMTTLAPR
ncbi:MAG: hypothetical protein HC922_08145 [Leptolyngbyaceae cyanobacterium SM2_3_12]|nr:hypothetical protein [Leptolyngbyaceae cyanobacterium SM2_3_12]